MLSRSAGACSPSAPWAASPERASSPCLLTHLLHPFSFPEPLLCAKLHKSSPTSVRWDCHELCLMFKGAGSRWGLLIHLRSQGSDVADPERGLQALFHSKTPAALLHHPGPPCPKDGKLAKVCELQVRADSNWLSPDLDR